jgi:hypothetical protein
MDQKRRNDDEYAFMKRMEDNKKKDTPDGIDLKTKGMGLFEILSSENTEVSKILSLYYTPQTMHSIRCMVAFIGFFKLRGECQPLDNLGLSSVEREMENKVFKRPCERLPKFCV